MRTPSDTPFAVCPVVLAGGRGTRLWPLSRAQHPKQFLALGPGRSLFQQALERLAALRADDIAIGGACVVGNDEHRHLIVDQLCGPAAASATVVLESCGRNTAAAITLAALHAARLVDDPVLVVTPADQTVADAAAFARALQAAARQAALGDIVVLGVVPDRPETGYGYIRAVGGAASSGVHEVERFVEKPDLATARGFLADGGYCWNSGIFVMRASVWLAALEACRPDILSATGRAWRSRSEDGMLVRLDPATFADIPAESADRAVLEKLALRERAQRGARLSMVALCAGWNDLGAWQAVWEASDKDADGNATHGDTLVHASRNALVHATSRLVGVVGLDDVVVVETPDAVLVADRSSCQDVRHIVAALHDQRRPEHDVHRRVHRPWGWYESITAGPRFQVKRIMVRPGARLSLQMHHHRAEHWVVVNGTAEVTCGERRLLLTENQSAYIPLGETHRLANPGTIALEIIEVQSGSYLGEDDIVRFDDLYGRVPAAVAEAA